MRDRTDKQNQQWRRYQLLVISVLPRHCVAVSTGAWIITGGTHTGVMKHVGEAVKDYALSSPLQSQIVAIGVATWGIIHNRDALVRAEVRRSGLQVWAEPCHRGNKSPTPSLSPLVAGVFPSPLLGGRRGAGSVVLPGRQPHPLPAGGRWHPGPLRRGDPAAHASREVRLREEPQPQRFGRESGQTPSPTPGVRWLNLVHLLTSRQQDDHPRRVRGAGWRTGNSEREFRVF